jgi:hypothetical protein
MNLAQAIEQLNQANSICDFDGSEQLQALRKLGRSLKIDLRGIRIYRDSFTPTLVEVWDTLRHGGSSLTVHGTPTACEAKAEYISGLIARHLNSLLATGLPPQDVWAVAQQQASEVK